MTVCNFFLEGRCRYGDTCWNEHPRGGAGGGGGGGGGGAGYGGYSRTQQQPSNNRGGGGGGGGGGFGNRVWVNPSQKSSGRDYVQSSSFAKSGGNEWGRGGGGGGGGGSEWRRGGAGGGGGGSEWGRGGGGERNTKSSNFSFSNQNRFSALDSQEAFHGGSQGDDNEKHVEVICKDMEVWESSGQWPFSCYSAVKASISGFTELSPEELRMEYYSGRASGDLQSYANSVQQLATQWSSRVQELKILTPTTRAALIAELNNPQSAAPGFPTVAASFGAGGFGATGSVVSSGFGSVDPPPAGPTGFGSASSAASFSFSTAPAPVPASFGAGSAPTAASFSTGPAPVPASFGATSAPTAASFSFSSSASSFAPPPATAAGFSFSAPGFGAPAAAPPPTVGGASFGQPAGGAGPVVGDAQDKLFTPQGELTPEELKEFTGKRFTLGQVPLRPPPAGLLVV